MTIEVTPGFMVALIEIKDDVWINPEKIVMVARRLGGEFAVIILDSPIENRVMMDLTVRETVEKIQRLTRSVVLHGKR